MSHQPTEGEQLLLTEILEQQFINGHRNSHVTIFFCPAIVNGEAGSITDTGGSAALGVQSRKAHRWLSTSIVLAACPGFAVWRAMQTITAQQLDISEPCRGR